MKFLDKENEPVRRWIYGALVSAVLVLAGYGIVTDTEVMLWTALLEALLVVPFVESARVKVRPTKGDENDGRENESGTA